MVKPPKPFAVTTPFVDDPGADVVLISSDKHNFRVRKAFLSFASSVFSDMFSIPQPSDSMNKLESHDGLPSILLAETGQVIDVILRYCYPRQVSIPPDNGFSFLALEAADKYDMPQVILAMELSIQKLRFSQPEALLFLYRRACDQRQESSARGYAWDCLKISQSSIVAHWGTNIMMDSLPNLINYHQAVSVKVGERVFGFDWSTLARSTVPASKSLENPYLRPGAPQQQQLAGGSDFASPHWWTIAAHICALRIQKEGPLSDKIIPLDGEQLGRHRLQSGGILGRDEVRKCLFQDFEPQATRVQFTLPWLPQPSVKLL